MLRYATAAAAEAAVAVVLTTKYLKIQQSPMWKQKYPITATARRKKKEQWRTSKPGFRQAATYKVNMPLQLVL